MSNQWDEQYKAGQGRYFPAEELVRFLGRTYGSVIQRKGLGQTAIEIGCGIGGNISALADWGFFTYGLECSAEALRLARSYAASKLFYASVDYQTYKAPELIKLPAGSAQLVIDIQTIQHLDEKDHVAMYQEIHRVLSSHGKFFCVHWAGSDDDLKYIFPAHPELAICQNARDVRALIVHAGFDVRYHEIVTKTYLDHEGRWAVFEAVKL